MYLKFTQLKDSHIPSRNEILFCIDFDIIWERNQQSWKLRKQLFGTEGFKTITSPVCKFWLMLFIWTFSHTLCSETAFWYTSLAANQLNSAILNICKLYWPYNYFITLLETRCQQMIPNHLMLKKYRIRYMSAPHVLFLSKSLVQNFLNKNGNYDELELIKIRYNFQNARWEFLALIEAQIKALGWSSGSL